MKVVLELVEPDGDSQEIILGPGHYRVGKKHQPGVDIGLTTAFSSRVHALLDISNDDVIYKDNNSTNGTLFEGEQILGPILLHADDVLVIGPAQLVVKDIDIQAGLSVDQASVVPLTKAVSDATLVSNPELSSTLPKTSVKASASGEVSVDFGELLPILMDEGVTAVMINGSTEIYVKRNGALRLDHSLSPSIVQSLVTSLLSQLGCEMSAPYKPINKMLAGGIQCRVVLPPLVTQGAAVVLEKPCRFFPSKEKAVKVGACSKEMLRFLIDAIHRNQNILICGCNGAGQTRWLNLLANMVKPEKRLVSVESARQLKLNLPHWISLQSPKEGFSSEYSANDFLKTVADLMPETLVFDGPCEDLLSECLLSSTGYTQPCPLLATAMGQSFSDVLRRWRIQLKRYLPHMSDALLDQCIASRFDIVVCLRTFPGNAWEKAVMIGQIVKSNGDYNLESLERASRSALEPAIHLSAVFEYQQQKNRFVAFDELDRFYKKQGMQDRKSHNVQQLDYMRQSIEFGSNSL